MRSDLFVYLSGPITARDGYSIEENVTAALKVYLDLLSRGVPCFCPHLSAAFPTAWTALPYDAWIAYDLAVIDRCTHVLLLDRWETSTGARIEQEYALAHGVPMTSYAELLATLAVAA